MKKLLTLFLALVMTFTCALTFSSCGRPEFDLKDAKKALEREDYSVYQIDDYDDTETPYIVESLSARNGDDFLYIYIFESSSMAKLYLESIEMQYEHELEEMKLELKTLKKTVKKYEKELDDDVLDKLEDEIDDLEDEIEEGKDELVFGRSGKKVWYGTKDAVKDSKR